MLLLKKEMKVKKERKNVFHQRKKRKRGNYKIALEYLPRIVTQNNVTLFENNEYKLNLSKSIKMKRIALITIKIINIFCIFFHAIIYFFN